MSISSDCAVEWVFKAASEFIGSLTRIFSSESCLQRRSMAETKLVLVSYLENNKVLKIPTNKGSVSDVEYLEQAFRREFFLRVDCKIGHHVPNEFIDLEADTELQQKDKVKAVVSTALVDPPFTPDTVTPEVSGSIKDMATQKVYKLVHFTQQGA